MGLTESEWAGYLPLKQATHCQASSIKHVFDQTCLRYVAIFEGLIKHNNMLEFLVKQGTHEAWFKHQTCPNKGGPFKWHDWIKNWHRRKNILAQESKSLENKTLDNLNNRNIFSVCLFVYVICSSIPTLV